MISNYHEGISPNTLLERPYRVKSIHQSLLIGEKYKEFYRPRVKRILKKTEKKIRGESKNVEDVLFPKDVPSLPVYMPKLLNRTPSPIKSTRSTFSKNKMNLLMPQLNSSPAELMLEKQKKINLLMTKVLNGSLKIEKIQSSPCPKPDPQLDKLKLTQYTIKLSKLIKRFNN